MKAELRYAVRQTLPVMIGYLFFGTAFGLMLQNIGYNFLWAMLASLVIYAGSMQFVLVSLLAGAFNLPAVILMTLTINSRHFFYGLPFLKKFREMGKAYLYMVFSLTDETYALLCSVWIPDHLDGKKVRFFIALFNHLYWITGSTLGALGGALLNIDLKGIEFTMTALFIVIFIEQWISATKITRVPAVVGLLCGLVLRLILGPDQFILPALIVTVTILLVLRPSLDRRSGEKEEEGSSVPSKR